MTWDLGCQPAAFTPWLYQAYRPLTLWKGIYRIRETAEAGIYVQFKDMAQRFRLFVLAFLQCGAVLANTPVDPALKPCGDAYYYPSKVHHDPKSFAPMLTAHSIHAMTRIFSALSWARVQR